MRSASFGRSGFDGPGLYSPEQGLDWRRYLAAIWRYKWLILFVVLAGTGLGVAASRYLIKPKYEARATVWIAASSGVQSGRSGEPIRSAELLRSYAWVDLLKSYQVLDSVVVDQKLYLGVDPEDKASLSTLGLQERFRPGRYRFSVTRDGLGFELYADSRLLQTGLQGDSVGESVGLSWVPAADVFKPGRTIQFTVGVPRDEATRLADNLDARIDERGNFLRLRLAAADPNKAAAVLNALTARYTDVAAELKREKLKQVAAILDDQLLYAEQRLREAETKLEGFRVQTATLPAERASPIPAGLERTRDPAYQQFFSLRADKDQVREDRELLTRILAEAPDSGLSLEGLEFVSARRNSMELRNALAELTERKAQLRAFRTLYTDEYPDVRETLEGIERLEQRTIPDIVERLIAELRARESELDASVASASRELRRVPPRAIEEAGLERRVDIAANFYTELQLRHEQALLAEANAIPDLRVLDPAIAPARPVNQRDRPLLILMALMSSLGLGLVGSILLDRIDRRLRYPEQVGLELGLPILGAVPHVASGDKQRSERGDAQILEAFRVIRLNVANAYGSAGPVVIAVTSPSGAEGKSLVSSNLALAFSELGRRTLLIDGDVRRGRLHRLFTGQRKPGLTDYLAGAVPRERIIQSIDNQCLDLLASGSRRQNAPELIQSSAMPALLMELRASYDVIIIDTPPVAAGADALALGTLTGNVLLVLRTGSTDRDLTDAKLEMLERLPLRILGAILNDVPVGGSHSYYYRYESYIPGYESKDEDGVTSVAMRAGRPVPSEVREGDSERATPDAQTPTGAGKASNPGLGREVTSRDDVGDLGNPGHGSKATAAGDGGKVTAPGDAGDLANPGGRGDGRGRGRKISAPLGAGPEGRSDASRADPQEELHRLHQRRNQLRQWR